MHTDDELKEAQVAGDKVQGPPDPHLLAQVEELKAKLETAEALEAQAAQPLPGESTKEFLHRGLNTSGAGLTGSEADALRAVVEEDAADFLARVGQVPIIEEGLSIERLDNTQPIGAWADTLDGRQLSEIRLAKLYSEQFAHGTAGHNRLMLIAQLAALLDAGDTPKPKPDPVNISGYRLDVQYHSQHEYDAQLTRRDCGPACIEMLGEYLRPAVDHSTDEIMVRITEGVDRSTYVHELQQAALEMFQITLHRVEHCSMIQLRDWILEDKPVIVLVHYGSFQTRMDRNYRSGHFMVVVGYEVIDYQGMPSLRFLVHDPDYYQVSMGGERVDLLDQGAFIPVTEAHLKAMWDDSIKDRNPVRLALVPEVM